MGQSLDVLLTKVYLFLRQDVFVKKMPNFGGKFKQIFKKDYTILLFYCQITTSTHTTLPSDL